MPGEPQTNEAPITWKCERCGATWDNRGDVQPCERLHDEPARCEIVQTMRDSPALVSTSLLRALADNRHVWNAGVFFDAGPDIALIRAAADELDALRAQVQPVTKLDSMAACLLAAWGDHATWKASLDRLQADPAAFTAFRRMAARALDHVPYLLADASPPNRSDPA